MARWLWVRCPPVRVRQGPLSSQAGGHRVHDGLSAHGYRVSRSAAAVAAAIAAATTYSTTVAATPLYAIETGKWGAAPPSPTLAADLSR